jgi:hypothetical protein
MKNTGLSAAEALKLWESKRTRGNITVNRAGILKLDK